jgi:hypothetical protein
LISTQGGDFFSSGASFRPDGQHSQKPILGRGAAVPILVVSLGAIGVFVAVGIIGLFVGAIVLPVGYKLFLACLETAPASEAP